MQNWVCWVNFVKENVKNIKENAQQIAVFLLILNSREKFEYEPGFEPRTISSLAWRSTI